MELLEGKKALIFGVANNRSIAYGCAKRFKEEGCELAFTYAGEALEKRVKPISEELGGKLCIPCDVSDDASVKACFETVEKEFGKFDILVHSVAFAPREALQGRYIDTEREDFKTALDISAYSLVSLAKASENLINDGGSIMCMSYLGAEKVVPKYNVMAVAKAALECSTRYLANDLGERQIRVNAISAGPIKTLAASGVGGLKELLNHVGSLSPLKRNVTQDEVGNTAVYLASDLSSGVTGETIYVDAGYNIIGI